MPRRDPDTGLPWARTWTALAVLAAVLGVLYAVLPYDQGTIVVGGDATRIRCEPPVQGAWGPDEDLDVAELDGEVVTRSCPGEGRERLAVGLVLVVVGVTGFAALRRVSPRRPAASRPPTPPPA